MPPKIRPSFVFRSNICEIPIAILSQAPFAKFIYIFASFFAFTSICWPAQSTTEMIFGTIYTGVFNENYIVVAMDSRVTQLDLTQRKDNVCKILPIADHLVFFSAGLTEAMRQGGIGFNDRQIAIETYRGINNHAPIVDIAAGWSRAMIKAYKSFFSNNPEDIRKIYEHNQNLISGYWGGEDLNGRLVLYDAEIVLSASGNVSGHDVVSVSPGKGENTHVIGNGNLQILQEMNGVGTSERGKAIMDAIRAESEGKSRPEKEAIWASHITRSLVDWGNDPRAGGEVVTLILERGQKWRWFPRSDLCPKN